MKKKLTCLLAFALMLSFAHAQKVTDYLRAHAVPIPDQSLLSDSVYQLLQPFQIVMLGEMHGTHEPARFVCSLVDLYTRHGDSVQVGLEIPAGQMQTFLSQHTDSSIYQSTFFRNPAFQSGRESMAWAGIVSKCLHNPRASIFFFDVETGEGKPFERDSLMADKIRLQCEAHPAWKTITLSGNMHNRIPKAGGYGNESMAAVLKRNISASIGDKICNLNHNYHRGSCTANFGKGLEEKQLENPASEYDTALTVDNYIVLVAATSTYPYSGFLYTKWITASKMVAIDR